MSNNQFNVPIEHDISKVPYGFYCPINGWTEYAPNKQHPGVLTKYAKKMKESTLEELEETLVKIKQQRKLQELLHFFNVDNGMADFERFTGRAEGSIMTEIMDERELDVIKQIEKRKSNG